MPLAEKGISGTAAAPVGVTATDWIAIQVALAGVIGAPVRPVEGSVGMPHAQVPAVNARNVGIVRGRLGAPRIDVPGSVPQRRWRAPGPRLSRPRTALRLRVPRRSWETRVPGPDHSSPAGLVPTEVIRAWTYF